MMHEPVLHRSSRASRRTSKQSAPGVPLFTNNHTPTHTHTSQEAQDQPVFKKTQHRPNPDPTPQTRDRMPTLIRALSRSRSTASLQPQSSLSCGKLLSKGHESNTSFNRAAECAKQQPSEHLGAWWAVLLELHSLRTSRHTEVCTN